jgi:hypothetical protein
VSRPDSTVDHTQIDRRVDRSFPLQTSALAGPGVRLGKLITNTIANEAFLSQGDIQSHGWTQKHAIHPNSIHIANKEDKHTPSYKVLSNVSACLVFRSVRIDEPWHVIMTSELAAWTVMATSRRCEIIAREIVWVVIDHILVARINSHNFCLVCCWEGDFTTIYRSNLQPSAIIGRCPYLNYDNQHERHMPPRCEVGEGLSKRMQWHQIETFLQIMRVGL